MKIQKLFTTLAFTTAYLSMYRLWHHHALKRLQSHSLLVETKLGPVEYGTYGEGPAVLIAHGSPGGYDQGLALAHLLHRPGNMTFVAPSRPGYLRTPLSTGDTPERQADLYAALLDTLNISQVTMLGISGGGPSALQFVLRHPKRCCGLVMISGVTHHYSDQELKLAMPQVQRFFSQLYAQLLSKDSLLFLLHPIARLLPDPSTMRDLLRSMMFYDLRKTGYENDMKQFATITTYPLGNITVPTLVIHGTADDEVPYHHAQHLMQNIPHVTLLSIPGGKHLAFYTHAHKVIPTIQKFLAEQRHVQRA